MSEKIIVIKNLKKYFPVQSGVLQRTTDNIHAVDGVDFYIEEGETLGLVGESGCGKTTLGKTLLRLYEPTAGEVFFKDTDILSVDKNDLRQLRRSMQIIFQDPFASLDPRMTVHDIIGEPFAIHKHAKGKEKEEKIRDLIRKVGLDPEIHTYRYPHEFSGGQRQRIGIARALAVEPEFIVCDEAVSALDVSVRAQILNLLNDLQKEFNLTYLFITHDLSVVRNICDRVAVMYLGKIVELADCDKLYENPKHPYTEALLSGIPIPDPNMKRERIILIGDVPTPINPPSGCRFHPRCAIAEKICSREDPELRDYGNKHFLACHSRD